MSDPFRQLILDQVELILKKTPDQDNLYALLKVTSPKLQYAEVRDEAKRNAAFRTLKLRIHPDKHQNVDTATKLFQDIQDFFDKGCRYLRTHPPQPEKKESFRGSNGSSTAKSKAKSQSAPPQRQKTPPPVPPPQPKPQPRPSSAFPPAFRVEDKWKHLASLRGGNIGDAASTARDMMLGMSAACINARGAIIHGGPTTRQFGNAYFEKRGCRTVEDAFEAVAEGCKKLRTAEAIKKEIYTRGPVVSVNFRLEDSFIQASENGHCFLAKAIGSRHPVLITGWKITAFGQVWIVKAMRDGKDNVENIIAFGQFGIDDEVLAPVSNFDNISWQKGTFFAYNLNDSSWKKLKALDMWLNNTDLQILCSCFETGFGGAIKQQTKFNVHPKEKKAHSRQCFLTDVDWHDGKGKWKASVRFTS